MRPNRSSLYPTFVYITPLLASLNPNNDCKSSNLAFSPNVWAGDPLGMIEWRGLAVRGEPDPLLREVATEVGREESVIDDESDLVSQHSITA